MNTTLFSFSGPMLDLCCGEHSYIHQEQMASWCRDRLEQLCSGLAMVFVSLPEGERLVIEFRRNTHVKIMFYLALRRVSLGRVHLSYQLHS